MSEGIRKLYDQLNVSPINEVNLKKGVKLEQLYDKFFYKYNPCEEKDTRTYEDFRVFISALMNREIHFDTKSISVRWDSLRSSNKLNQIDVKVRYNTDDQYDHISKELTQSLILEDGKEWNFCVWSK